MSEKLTQEQLNEWSYLQDQELYSPLKSELEENEEKKNRHSKALINQMNI